jgi:hypothetical protein
MPGLVAAMRSEDDSIHEVASRLIDRLPQHALAPHALELARLLQTSHSVVPVLGKLGLSADADVRAALCEALQSQHYETRVNALHALGEQPSEPLAAYVPALIQVRLSFEWLEVADEYPHDFAPPPEDKVRELAFEVLELVDPSELVEHMEPAFEALRDEDRPVTVREMAMNAVSLLPPSTVVPHKRLLLQVMSEPNGGEGLGEDMDEEDDLDFDALESADRMRETAGQVLLGLEPPLRLSKRLVRKLLEDLEDSCACRGAVILLGKLPPAKLSDHFGALLRAFLYRCGVKYLEGEPWRLIVEQMEPSALAEHTDEFQ